MDEIKNVIQDLPADDIMILKALYNPDAAKAEMSAEGQRLVSILDGLTPEEQQEAVNVEPAEMIEPEPENPSPETEQSPADELPQGQQLPEGTSSVGSLEDYLI